jgi:hypothetical protein
MATKNAERKDANKAAYHRMSTILRTKDTTHKQEHGIDERAPVIRALAVLLFGGFIIELPDRFITKQVF